jgi:hypothetical protein
MKSMILVIIIVVPLLVLVSFSLIPISGHASFEGGSRSSMVQGAAMAEVQIQKNECTQNQQFGPGPHPSFTGPIHWPWPSSDNIKGYGFSKIVQVYDRGDEIDDFILEPTHSAQIGYSLYVKSNGFSPRNLVWITNDAGFMHRTNDTIVHPKIVDDGNWTFSNGTTTHMWYVCTSVPEGSKSCGPEYGLRPSDTVSLPTIVFDHPGISVSYWPPLELVGIIPVTVTATVSADKDALQGTYWMYLAPGPNDGGPEVLLTIGSCSK